MKSTLLLSIHPRFVEAIVAGTKRVELRRRFPCLGDEDRVVVYATSPTMALVGAFDIDSVVRKPLGPLWRQVREVAGVTYAEFLDYFDGLAEGLGIFIGDYVRFPQQVPLSELRRIWPGFHPPQGYRFLDRRASESLHSFSARRRKAG